jgi:cytochrome c553
MRRIRPLRSLPATVLGAIAILATAGMTGTLAPAHAGHTLPDTLAQRVAACTGCHGNEGRAAPDGFHPRIAGKPSGYLHQQLLNFRDGQRRHGAMAHLLADLDDAYLAEIALHFAKQNVPYPAPRVATASAATRARGRALVIDGDVAGGIPPCAACHGERLTGVAPAVPGLLGLPRDYLNAQLGGWKNGLRKARAPDCMATIASRLSPQDIEAVSAWLSSQPVPAQGRAVTAFVAKPTVECGSLVPDRGGSSR